jgi:hypothetical protein
VLPEAAGVVFGGGFSRKPACAVQSRESSSNRNRSRGRRVRHEPCTASGSEEKTMESKQPIEICQSCGLPLDSTELFGTDSNGVRIAEYCVYCFHNGAFTEPAVTRDEIIERVADQLIKTEHMCHIEAEDIAKSFVPYLKRWHQPIERAHG